MTEYVNYALRGPPPATITLGKAAAIERVNAVLDAGSGAVAHDLGKRDDIDESKNLTLVKSPPGCLPYSLRRKSAAPTALGRLRT